MKVIVLGSGTCVPSLKRNSPGYYLESDTCQILIDCGSGTLRQLVKAGRSYRNIDAVFITHMHPDHFSDLMPFIHALIATPKYYRSKELAIFSPGGFVDYYEKAIASIIGHHQSFSIDVMEARIQLHFGPFHVSTVKTIHSSDSIAYRFEQDDKSVVFTGDADYDQGLIDFARDSDLLIADCSYPDSMKVKGHLSARECGLIAQKGAVKRLLLSHLYPADSPDIKRIAESREVFDGEVILAEDLMEINI